MNKQIKLLQFVLILISLAIAMASCKDDEETFYRVQINGLYGFVDEKGEIKIVPQYKYVSNFSEDGYALVISTIREGFCIDGIDENGYRVPVEQGKEIHYGIIDKNNHVVIDTTMISYEHLPDSICSQFDNKELSFNEIVLPDYEPSNGLFKVKIAYNDLSSGETGYKNIKNGHIINAYALDNNRLFLRHDGIDDILDSKGKVIGSYPFGDWWDDRIIDSFDFNRNLFTSANYKQGKKWVRTPMDCVFVQFDDDYRYIGGDQKAVVGAKVYRWLLIDTCGQIHEKLICAGRYGFLYEGDNLSIVVNSHDSICELINQYELTGVRFKLNDGHYLPLSEGYFGLKKSWGEQYGWAFCNSELTHRSPEIYEDIKPFKNGLAAVKINGKWGYVDHSFQLVIPNDYDDCGNFDNGWAYFMKVDSKGKHEGYIDKQGHIVWQTMRKK